MGLLKTVLVIICIVFPFCNTANGKVFEKCELARLLKDKHRLPIEEVANWVCIAKHQSNLKSDLRTGSPDNGAHGLFQISDQYWCSPPGKGEGCGIPCDRLRDDDLTDDLSCVAKIYDEHQRISGDGFTAWTTYERSCKGRARKLIEECFDSSGPKKTYNFFESSFNSFNSFEVAPNKAKVYSRCELAKELRYKHKIPVEQIATWVCIAKHESSYNTSAIGRLNADGSGDHGLFQISDIYWCSPPGNGWACGLSCDELEDSDITDDVECIKRIYEEHNGISGDGFNAWAVYKPYCKGKSDNYIDGCFDDVDLTNQYSRQPDLPSYSVAKPQKHPIIKPTKPGKVYTPCELANELRYKYLFPREQVATWVCIAKHESNFNTSAIGRLNTDGSGDHGLFQISDIYWCSPPGNGWVCGLSCDELEDSDISDDIECMKKIYDEHQGLSGDGFNAWSVYKPHCKGKADKYISGCFNDFDTNTIDFESPSFDRGSHKSLNKPPSKNGKVYSSCELAKELRYKHGIPLEQIDTWVCIAKHESNFNTSAVGRLNGDGSGDHGLFQISDIYWCSPPGNGWACGLSCNDLEDSDITDDVECIKKIYEEHNRLSGDGFNAWAVYNPYCKGKSRTYISGCFDEFEDIGSNAIVPVQQKRYSFSGPSKTYTRCELAEELRVKHRLPENQIATWVCIAEHESRFDTAAMNSGSGDHGLFQISELFWCDKSGPGKECRVECSKFRDNDISDDVECIKKIYKEHNRLSGDGFNAWVVYPLHCKGRADEYIKDCRQTSFQPQQPTERPSIIIPAITAPTNLLDYRQQFLKVATATKDPITNVRFSDFLRKPSDNFDSFFSTLSTTTKAPLYSYKFSDFFRTPPTNFVDRQQNSITVNPSSQSFDDKFFSSAFSFGQKSQTSQPENQLSAFSLSPTRPTVPSVSFGVTAGSRFNLASDTKASFETTTRKPTTLRPGSRISFDDFFNFDIKTTTTKPITTQSTKLSTSREDRFAGFAAFDATSHFSTTKSYSKPTVPPLKNTQANTSFKIDTPAKTTSRYDLGSFGPTSTPNPNKEQNQAPKDVTNIYDFYLDLYKLRQPAGVSTLKRQPSGSIFAETTINSGNSRDPTTKQPFVYNTFQTTTSRPYVSSFFSATPEFRGFRFGSAYDGNTNQNSRVAVTTSTVKPTTVISRSTRSPYILRSSEKNRAYTNYPQKSVERAQPTTRPFRINESTTFVSNTGKSRRISGFRFGSYYEQEDATRKPFRFEDTTVSRSTKNTRTAPFTSENFGTLSRNSKSAVSFGVPTRNY